MLHLPCRACLKVKLQARPVKHRALRSICRFDCNVPGSLLSSPFSLPSPLFHLPPSSRRAAAWNVHGNAELNLYWTPVSRSMDQQDWFRNEPHSRKSPPIGCRCLTIISSHPYLERPRKTASSVCQIVADSRRCRHRPVRKEAMNGLPALILALCVRDLTYYNCRCLLC